MIPVLFVALSTLGNPAANTHEEDMFVSLGHHRGEQVKFYATKLENPDGSEFTLDKRAAIAYKKLVDAASQEGFTINVNSGHRTYNEQVYMKNKFGAIAAKPGWSTHESGLSVDLAGTFRFIKYEDINMEHFSEEHCVEYIDDGGYKCKTVFYWWLTKNAPKYGFANDVEGEPWHWTFQLGTYDWEPLFNIELEKKLGGLGLDIAKTNKRDS